MTQLRVGSVVAWVPWSHAAFERARDEQKVVLLSLSAPWSAACRQMDGDCYHDPAIVEEINRWFIPIRVDADRRPDIADRYELGGLPTTAFLDADGEVLGGGTFVPPDRLIEALRRAKGQRGAPLPRSADGAEAEGGGEPPPVDDQLVDLVFSTFDEHHAGFGTAPKFPLVAPVQLAIDLFHETQSEKMADYAVRTLDAMAWGGLFDEESGGFFRCACAADWHDSPQEKLLSTNAALLKLYLQAGAAFDNQRWLARAADVVEFVQGQLAVAPGKGWRASSQSDDACLSDANAAMVSSALLASQVLGDESLRDLALQTLESVLLDNYRPGAGVAHCRGGISGLLSDHVAMAAAHLDAWEVTGDVVYQMMAQELVEFMRRTLQHGDSFVDRASRTDDVGRLAEPLIPFVLNCEAAEVLHRLGRATEDPTYAQLASRVLESAHGRAAAHGPLAAHYVLARRALSR